MRIYLAGTNGMKQAFQEEKIIPTSVNVLESFYSIQEWQINFIHKFNDFVLDSGAFTFLNSKKKKIDFVKYAEEYANFICENKIEKFVVHGETLIDGIEEEGFAGGTADPAAIDTLVHKKQLKNFIKAVFGEEELLIDATEGKRAVKLIREIYTNK